MLLLTGCIRGSLPPRELYRIDQTPAASGSADTAATPSRSDGGASNGTANVASIVVRPYETPGVYSHPQIVYRVDAVQYGTYPHREWALPLGVMLAALTAEVLQRELAPGTTVRTSAGPAPAGGFVWRGAVREFEEVDREQTVHAAVRLQAALVRAEDDSVLWQGEARLERPVSPATSMSAVVEQLAAAAVGAVGVLARQASPVLHAAPRTARNRTPP
jgi:ABC-type uncharacterized transport system auxiliary subunit